MQRPITGQLHLAALRTLYDLLVAQSDSIGARIGLAVVMADAGDPLDALAELDTLAPMGSRTISNGRSQAAEPQLLRT